jgi:hypothetical protein
MQRLASWRGLKQLRHRFGQLLDFAPDARKPCLGGVDQ